MNHKRYSKTQPNPKTHYCKSQHKRRFPDKKSADNIIKYFSAKQAINAISPNQNIPVRAYFCLHCKGYHLTSQRYFIKE